MQQTVKRPAKILVVDDEPQVLQSVSRTLRDEGFDVLEAGGGEEAAKVYDGSGRNIDLLISDVVMPRFNGRALAQLLKERQPNLKVVFMSGYAVSSFYGEDLWVREVPFLPKPFTKDALLSKVRGTLFSYVGSEKRPAAEPAGTVIGGVTPGRDAPRVLVVEDDPLMAKTLAHCLTCWGCRAETAENGEAGLAKVKEAYYSLVLLDLNLPVMGGIEFFKEARALRPRLPVIIVTGMEDEALAEAAKKLGALDYILKPFDAKHLRLRVNQAIGI